MDGHAMVFQLSTRGSQLIQHTPSSPSQVLGNSNMIGFSDALGSITSPRALFTQQMHAAEADSTPALVCPIKYYAVPSGTSMAASFMPANPREGVPMEALIL